MIGDRLDSRPRGRSIVIVGPDGAGKSALGRGRDRAPRWRRAGRARPPAGAGPAASHTALTGRLVGPHAQEPYGRYATIAKVAWLFADMQAMWRVIGAPDVAPRATRRRRARVVGSRRRPAALPAGEPGSCPPARRGVARAGPRGRADRPGPYPRRANARAADRGDRPTVACVARASADGSRRPAPRCRSADPRSWSMRCWNTPRVRGPSDGVIAAVRHDRKRADRWVHLPLGGEPMWHVPRSPRATAAAGLRHPSSRSRAGRRSAWWIARRSRSMGGFRLLPGHPAPEAIGSDLPRSLRRTQRSRSRRGVARARATVARPRPRRPRAWPWPRPRPTTRVGRRLAREAVGRGRASGRSAAEAAVEPSAPRAWARDYPACSSSSTPVRSPRTRGTCR